MLCCQPTPSLLLQGKRAALRSSTLMIRQPLQRLAGMQASDIDIYRRVTREKTSVMVRVSSSSSCVNSFTGCDYAEVWKGRAGVACIAGVVQCRAECWLLPVTATEQQVLQCSPCVCGKRGGLLGT